MTRGQRPRRHACDSTSRVCRVVALAVAMVETNVKMKTRSGKREEPTTKGGVKSWEKEKVTAVLYPF